MTHQPPVTPVDIGPLKPMASESLDAFATVAGHARTRIEPRGGHVPDVLAQGHSMNAMQGMVNIGRIIPTAEKPDSLHFGDSPALRLAIR
jgi:hypothetical protein